MAGHVLAWLAAAVVGAVTAVAALAVHRSGLPWLVLAAAASTGVAWVLRSSDDPRLAASYCLGWLVAFGVAVAGRGEGDFVVASDAAGYSMMAVGLTLVVLGVTSLTRRGVGPGA